jgi:hypothetical protein
MWTMRIAPGGSKFMEINEVGYIAYKVGFITGFGLILWVSGSRGVHAFRSINSYRGGSFKAWLMRIVTNACYDETAPDRSLNGNPMNTTEYNQATCSCDAFETLDHYT